MGYVITFLSGMITAAVLLFARAGWMYVHRTDDRAERARRGE